VSAIVATLPLDEFPRMMKLRLFGATVSLNNRFAGIARLG
jgi:hypothetical protein